jgi:hypothetical protein
MIRNLELKDLLKIEKLHHNDFPLPDINDNSYIIQKTLLNDKEIIGACFARLTSELVLILDPNLSSYQRAKAWKEVAGTMIQELIKKGIRSTHVFVTPESDNKYVHLLEQKLGFTRATGIPMYLEVNRNGQESDE